MKRLTLGLLVLLLLALAYNGLYEGVIATQHAGTTGMKLATATQLGYGVSAAVALAALAFRKGWAIWPVLVAAISAILTAGLAPVVYAGTSAGTGLLSGAGAALVLGLIVWGWRKTERR